MVRCYRGAFGMRWLVVLGAVFMIPGCGEPTGGSVTAVVDWHPIASLGVFRVPPAANSQVVPSDPIEHRFRFRNTTFRSISLSKYSVSCACLQVATSAPVIPSGEEFDVLVSSSGRELVESRLAEVRFVTGNVEVPEISCTIHYATVPLSYLEPRASIGCEVSAVSGFRVDGRFFAFPRTGQWHVECDVPKDLRMTAGGAQVSIMPNGLQQIVYPFSIVAGEELAIPAGRSQQREVRFFLADVDGARQPEFERVMKLTVVRSSPFVVRPKAVFARQDAAGDLVIAICPTHSSTVKVAFLNGVQVSTVRAFSGTLDGDQLLVKIPIDSVFACLPGLPADQHRTGKHLVELELDEGFAAIELVVY